MPLLKATLTIENILCVFQVFIIATLLLLPGVKYVAFHMVWKSSTSKVFLLIGTQEDLEVRGSLFTLRYCTYQSLLC